LFYAPYLLEPKVHDEVVSQVDVLPTIAGLLHQPYTNTTLGRDVLATSAKNSYAFTIHHDEGRIGIITNSYYFEKNINFNDEELYSMDNSSLPFTKTQQDSIKSKMSEISTGIYETAKWMLMNNK
ncbi:MAG: hypothetical protein JST09_11275, partial [Bacteroidetes bacterium]|nr:hypothetical protein [Bacteroidota bacterium]